MAKNYLDLLHTEAPSMKEEQLYRGGINWKKVKKYGIPAAIAGSALSLTFLVKSVLNDHQATGEEVMRNLNPKALIMQRANELESRGIKPELAYKIAERFVREGWVKVDKDYKPKDIVEKIIKKESIEHKIKPPYMRYHGKDENLLSKFNNEQVVISNWREVIQKYDDWRLVDIAFYGNNYALRYLWVKKKGKWFILDLDEID